MPGIKLSNEYVAVLGPLFERTPKAVLGAVVVSLLSCGGDDLEQVRARLLNEWRVLHENGIVPQAPVSGGQE